MDYAERLSNLDEHIRKHPTDYQAVISRLKIQSDAYENRMYKRKIARLKRLSEIRKMRKAGENECQ